VCAAVTVVTFRARGDVALAGASTRAQAVGVAAGVALALSAIVRRHGGQRARLALFAGACAWLAAEWGSPGAPNAVVFTIGLVVYGVSLSLVLVGALERQGARRAVAVAWAAMGTAAAAGLAQGLAPALVADPRTLGCGDCPADLVAVAADPALGDRIARFAGWTLAIAGIVAGLLLIRQIGRASGHAWVRAGLPHAAAAGFAVAMAGATAATLAPENVPGAPERWRFAAAVALLALAAAPAVRWLWLRRARNAIAQATTALDSLDGAALERLLGDVLGDATLTIGYLIPGAGFLSASGKHLDLPPTDAEQSVTPIVQDGHQIAALVHRAETAIDKDLLRETVAAARLRLDAERLRAGLLARAAILRDASRRIVAVSDVTRLRLERDLHDGAQQRLIALRFSLGVARSRAVAGSHDELARVLARADAAVEQSLAELRELVQGLHPARLEADGLAAAIADAIERSPAGLAIGELPDVRLPAEIERTVYQVVAQALAIVTSAGAAHGRVEAPVRDGFVLVRVEHDAPRLDAERTALLADRVGAVGGLLRIETDVPGAITASLPCG
jgi:signal transduction histidine kinase